MKKTSKNSGAKDAADRYFDKHYRGKDGKVLWDKLRQALTEAAKHSKPISFSELVERHRDRKKKEDGNNGQAA